MLSILHLSPEIYFNKFYLIIIEVVILALRGFMLMVSNVEGLLQVTGMSIKLIIDSNTSGHDEYNATIIHHARVTLYAGD